MVNYMDLSFYKGKKVFVTGHTGFKGSWMCSVLLLQGADVVGYATEPPTSPSLFKLLEMDKSINSIIGDIRNLDFIKKNLKLLKPEVVIHMAAQPIVRDSYKDPVCTYETNVMGTVNILEAIRECDFVRSFLNVTTDKVYHNNEWAWGYRENDILDGYDPYSNSKSCSELVTSSYKKSFFENRNLSISTARAGNVIGGGDFANDRIIPDCVRAASSNEVIIIRNPFSIRPYQHVLEPINAYLMIAAKQYEDNKLSGCYNIGPDDCDCISTGELANLFCNYWPGMKFINKQEENAPHEANFLKLDCSFFKSQFQWQPRWNISKAVEKTVEWSKGYIENANINLITQEQIKEYLAIR